MTVPFVLQRHEPTIEFPRWPTRRASTSPAGELLAPILSRVISMFATRADFSVDELSDAVLLSDAISAGGPSGVSRTAPRGSRSPRRTGSFEVRVGPLGDGGGQRLLDGMRIPSLDASLETLADEVRVEHDGRRRGAGDPASGASAS